MKFLILSVVTLGFGWQVQALDCQSSGRAGQKLSCQMTYNYASRSVDSEVVSSSYADMNHDEPADGSNACKALMTYADKTAQLRFSVVADEDSVVWMSVYQNGSLKTPEISAASIHKSKVSAHFNFGSKPIKDMTGQTIYSIRFSCLVE